MRQGGRVYVYYEDIPAHRSGQQGAARAAARQAAALLGGRMAPRNCGGQPQLDQARHPRAQRRGLVGRAAQGHVAALRRRVRLPGAHEGRRRAVRRRQGGFLQGAATKDVERPDAGDRAQGRRRCVGQQHDHHGVRHRPQGPDAAGHGAPRGACGAVGPADRRPVSIPRDDPALRAIAGVRCVRRRHFVLAPALCLPEGWAVPGVAAVRAGGSRGADRGRVLRHGAPRRAAAAAGGGVSGAEGGGDGGRGGGRQPAAAATRRGREGAAVWAARGEGQAAERGG